jgi:hypothetical protein
VIDADVLVPLGRSGRVRVVGVRDANYASNFVDIGRLRYRNVFIYKRAQGQLSFDLPAAFLVTGTVSGEEARYALPYPYPDEFHVARRLDHRLTLGAALQRRFGETFRIGGYITWDRLVSTLPAYSYQGARYGLSAEIVP